MAEKQDIVNLDNSTFWIIAPSEQSRVVLQDLEVQVGIWNAGESHFEGCVIDDAAFDNLDKQWDAFYWEPEQFPQLQEAAIAQTELAAVGQALDDLLDEMMSDSAPWTVDAVQAALADSHSVTIHCPDMRLELSRTETGSYHYSLDAGAGGGCTFGDCPHWNALATELDGWLLNNPLVTGLNYGGGLTEVLTIATMDIQNPKQRSRRWGNHQSWMQWVLPLTRNWDWTTCPHFHSNPPRHWWSRGLRVPGMAVWNIRHCS